MVVVEVGLVAVHVVVVDILQCNMRLSVGYGDSAWDCTELHGGGCGGSYVRLSQLLFF